MGCFLAFKCISLFVCVRMLLLTDQWVGPGSLVDVFLAIFTYLSLLNEGIVTTCFEIM